MSMKNIPRVILSLLAIMQLRIRFRVLCLYNFAISKELWADVMLVTPCSLSAKSNRLLAVAECCSIRKLACY
jgi:hypothetical protein